jgi:hypothetical protein
MMSIILQVDMRAIFGDPNERRSMSRQRAIERENRMKAANEEKAAEMQRRREDAEGAFQSWLARKRAEAARSRSASRTTVNNHLHNYLHFILDKRARY